MINVLMGHMFVKGKQNPNFRRILFKVQLILYESFSISKHYIGLFIGILNVVSY